ncbi:MAG: Signal peptidase I [Microgenomates group bacterium GW2011_GWC1_37_8]|uniref:Signal peptidase I n=1 Tax=Candidatus Woesebacteria bacterium GW2011_GWB1_38_8 TaxID=1618570 RepID=A0A0G0LBN9_9BACT|nr:MAG: Signal peptidase I [Microgenomates group bacterium GW2011_GWC1_37_8]KKQ85270.1 MAG: Signal peptidase I [Candidatus Woesebacteria bacterium GW2011_GWB1_38_8]
MVKYTTIDYLRDSYGVFDSFYMIFQKLSQKFKKLSANILEIEYDTYIFKIFENLPNALAILFLGFFAVFTLFKFTEKGSGFRVSTITTNSMRPSIQPGSVIISLPQKYYKNGDIVSYKELNSSTQFPTGRAVTHRIVDDNKINEKTVFVTKGDSNDYPDPGVIENKNIFGKVVLIIPNLGYFDVIVRTIPGFLLFIAIPAFIVIKNEYKYLRK